MAQTWEEWYAFVDDARAADLRYNSTVVGLFSHASRSLSFADLRYDSTVGGPRCTYAAT